MLSLKLQVTDERRQFHEQTNYNYLIDKSDVENSSMNPKSNHFCNIINILI